MEDEKEAVNAEETSAAPENETPVIENAESPATESSQATQEPMTVNGPQEPDWKNRYMESERKWNSDLPKVIRETVTEALQTQKQTYTKEHIPMLKQLAKDSPQYSDWVEQQVENIKEAEFAKTVKNELSSFKQEQANAQIRQQSEQWVTNHPKFKDCFMSDFTGQKVWNQSHPLAQAMIQVLNTPDPVTGKLVKDRPDAMMVAAELAYGRYSLNTDQAALAKSKQLSKEVRKAQKVQMTPMGGNAPQVPGRSNVQKAIDNYVKSNAMDKGAIKDATRSYLLSKGLIKEE